MRSPAGAGSKRLSAKPCWARASGARSRSAPSAELIRARRRACAVLRGAMGKGEEERGKALPDEAACPGYHGGIGRAKSAEAAAPLPAALFLSLSLSLCPAS